MYLENDSPQVNCTKKNNNCAKLPKPFSKLYIYDIIFLYRNLCQKSG